MENLLRIKITDSTIILFNNRLDGSEIFQIEVNRNRSQILITDDDIDNRLYLKTDLHILVVLRDILTSVIDNEAIGFPSNILIDNP